MNTEAKNRRQNPEELTGARGKQRHSREKQNEIKNKQRKAEKRNAARDRRRQKAEERNAAKERRRLRTEERYADRQQLRKIVDRGRRRRTAYMIATAVAALLIIVVAVVLRGVSDLRSYNEYMAQAQQSYSVSDYDSALAALRKAEAIDPSEECLTLMVDCYENQGNYTKALEILRRMDTLNPAVTTRISSIENRRQLLAESEKVTIAGRRLSATTTSLVLDDMELTDSVFTEISQLYALESLSLAGNSISNVSALANMGGLVSLNLSDNDISDISPLTTLVGLRTLYLDNNPIEDFSPLCVLPNLTSLSIKGIDITEAQLEALSKSLPNCAIHSDADPDEEQDISFGGVTFKSDVTELDLSGMGLRDISALGNCKQLTKLDLSDNEISDLSPLMNLPNLEWVDVSGNQLTDIRPLMGIEKLIYIDASDNNINSTSPVSMMNGVEELYLDGNPIRDFSGLRKVKSLKVLGLGDTGLTDGDLEYLEKLTLLTNLNIEDNPNISGEAVDQLQSKLATCSISHSELAYNIDVDGHTVSSDATELDLSGTGISDLTGLAKLSSLEKVDLSRNSISNIYILEFTNSRKTIRELNLSGNLIEDITPLASLQAIEVLDLSNNMISSETPLMNLKSLKTLYLGGNKLSELQIDNLQNALLDCEIILD